jgi:L-2-hydroxyglutarate oxidase LhgO
MTNVRRLLTTVPLLNDPVVGKLQATDSNAVSPGSLVVCSAANAQARTYNINHSHNHNNVSEQKGSMWNNSLLGLTHCPVLQI